ncbi:uroporphyrinogen decarboxylase family protein [Acetobacterium malicum]|nr:uroporphyrinogen decarboxylase family protein [Acetobacterium malicum]
MEKFKSLQLEMDTDEVYEKVVQAYGYDFLPYQVPKYNTPITPKENVRRMLAGEGPLWVPNINCDFNLIQPEIMLDASARNRGGVDWFGIDWEYEELSQAAMVKPGTRRLSDICNWEDELIWPDLDAIDWAVDFEKNYAPFVSADKATMFVIVNGCFERLADLTSFEDTLCCLLEEPEEVSRLFDKFTDFHIRLMAIAKEYYHADMITYHDDMGTQRNSFMSEKTFRELIVPHSKKLVAADHAMGLSVNYHSCGHVENLIDAFIDCGFDFWEGQDSANNIAVVTDNYQDKIGIVSAFDVGSDEAAMKANVLKRITEHGRYGKYIVWPFSEDMEIEIKSNAEIYRVSREFFSRTPVGQTDSREVN